VCVSVPVVCVAESLNVAKAPEIESVEANDAFVVADRLTSNTCPVIPGVVTAVEYVGENERFAISPDTAVPVAADCVSPAARMPPVVKPFDVEFTVAAVPVVKPFDAIVNNLLVVSHPNPLDSEVIELVPLKKEICPLVPVPVIPPIPDVDCQLNTPDPSVVNT
jgi:hypothetical protein